MKPIYLPDGSFDWDKSLFHFEPSKPGAYIIIAFFFLAFVIHTVQAVRLKAGYMAPLIVGCLLEIFGFTARVIAAKSPFDTGPYAGQQTLIIIAPVFFAATLYLILKHIVAGVDPSVSPLRPTRIAWIFVGCDVLSFAVQGGGSGILVSAGTNVSQADMGVKIMIVGLFIQVVSFLFFLVLAAVFYRRAVAAGLATPGVARWTGAFWVEVACALIVFVRSLFRVIEFWQGFDGPIAKVEALMYIFDAGLMALVVYLLAVFHPARALRMDSIVVAVSTDSYKP
ncbi:RTA1 like protein-domain-containing protein [Zopfochytrium polystomum]|nr:RTA1 like protein-domain-containing protein [Zopfochytrium polystomum]